MIAVLSALVSTVLFAWLLFVEPFMGVRNYHRLAKLAPELPRIRANIYLRWMRDKAVCLGLIALAVLPVAGLGSLGLRAPRPGSGSVIVGLLLAMGVVASVSVLAAFGQARFRFHATKGLERRARIVPRDDAVERFDWAMLSLVSGIVEELLYRGFGIFYLQRYLGFGVISAVMLTSLAFGLAHVYQGWRGVLSMTFLGLGLGFLYASTGSVLPPIALHVLVDLRVLLIFRRHGRPQLV